MSTLGERFRAAREARGLSLSEVSEQIRIRSVYLGAIEDQNWSVIGAPVYIRGFLRTYARFLGLDSEELVRIFNSEEPSATPLVTSATPTYESSEPEPGPNLSPLVWIASLVAVALIAFVFYNEVTMHNRAASPVAMVSPAEATPSPAESPGQEAAASPDGSAGPGGMTSPGISPSPGASMIPGASPSPEPDVSPGEGGPQTIQVVLYAPSWLRVTVDGGVSMEGTFPAGTEKLFHGKAAALRIGNAGGVVVYVDGKNAGPLGASGAVVDRSFSL